MSGVWAIVYQIVGENSEDSSIIQSIFPIHSIITILSIAVEFFCFLFFLLLSQSTAQLFASVTCTQLYYARLFVTTSRFVYDSHSTSYGGKHEHDACGNASASVQYGK